MSAPRTFRIHDDCVEVRIYLETGIQLLGFATALDKADETFALIGALQETVKVVTNKAGVCVVGAVRQAHVDRASLIAALKATGFTETKGRAL